MSAIVSALFAELDDQALEQLAERLRPYLRSESDGARVWLDVAGAGEYLCCPKSRIYALVSARRIPHHKDGSRTLFRRDELDAWVRAGGAKRP